MLRWMDDGRLWHTTRNKVWEIKRQAEGVRSEPELKEPPTEAAPDRSMEEGKDG